MTIITAEEDRLAARRHLRECLLIVLDAIDVLTDRAARETNLTARDNIEAEIEDLKAEVYLLNIRYEALGNLRPGSRLTRPSPEAVNRVMALLETVEAETQAARRAELILNILDETIALAGEVKRLRSEAA